MTFDSFNLHPHIMTGVNALGYKTPSPIQEKAIPAILEGQDVMGLAQTGTGKTAAFVLPILQRLMSGPRGKIRSLIITPTRELAQQIQDSIEELGRDCGLRSVALYGGISIYSQIHKLRKGVEIVVACPGRLLDHQKQGTINLKDLEVLVLDEADQMFDMGFLPNVRKILQVIPKKRQSLLFSATMPKDVRHLAEEILHKPVTIQIGHSAPTKTVAQALFPVPPHLKTDLLIKILQKTDAGSVLVFTRTKHRAQKLAEQLGNAGYTVASLQGNLSQARRQAAMSDFRKGKTQILVATDIASRGIDIASITHVINYDMPQTVEAYTHRIGRTGRASKLGDAFTLLTREDFSRVRAIERILGTKLEQRIFEDFDYKAKTPFDTVPADHDYQEGRSSNRPPFKSHRSENSRDRQPRFSKSSDGRPRHQGEKPAFKSESKRRDHGASRPQFSRSDDSSRSSRDDQPQRRRSASDSHFNERSRTGEKRHERPAYGEHAPKRRSTSSSHYDQRPRSDERSRSRFNDSPRSNRDDQPQRRRSASDSHFNERSRTGEKRHERPAYGEQAPRRRETLSLNKDRRPRADEKSRSRFSDSSSSKRGDQPHKRKSTSSRFNERSRTDEKRGASTRPARSFQANDKSPKRSNSNARRSFTR